jgi:hypothetical protein
MMQHQTFASFVANKQDLAGLIAYALYKADKVEFAKLNPDADINGFVLTANLPSQIEAYRTRAELMLEDMVEEALGEALAAADRDYSKRIQRFEDALGFWSGVRSNVVANLIAAAISILLVVLVFGNKLNFWSGVVKYFTE